MLGYTDLATQYSLNFGLVQHYNFSLTELENLIPFEREFYVAMVEKMIKDKQE